MHKLVIIIDAAADTADFHERWPQFLRLAESMPGLLREATVRVERVLFGGLNCFMLHELYFADAAALQKAMSAPVGVQAGQLLQQMTQGKMVLLMADHREDEAENLKKYRQPPSTPPEPAP